MNDPRSDEALIEAINHAERGRPGRETPDPGEAFSTLYTRHKDWAMAVALRFTRDRELAADAVQETFLYFLRKFPGFALTCRLRTFLYPAIKNTALAMGRKRARESPGASTFETMAVGDVSGPDAPGSDRLAQAVSDLPEGQREVVLMRFVDSLQLGEIAVALGIPVGTVKSRLHHAIQALRNDDRVRDYWDQESP